MTKNKITNIEIISYTAKKDDTLPHFIKMMKKSDRTINGGEGYYKDFFLEGITPLKKDISNEELANRLNTSWEMLRKRLNQSKDLNRDYLIAICSQIQLGSFLTNYALGLAKLPLLCAESKPKESTNLKDKVSIINLRDKAIMAILDRCAENYMSIPQINSKLKLEFEKLDLYNEFAEEISYPFVIFDETRIKTDYDYAIYNPDNSLETLYNIDQYKISATKKLELNSTKDILSLTLFDDLSAEIVENENPLNTKYYDNYKDLNESQYLLIFEDLKDEIKLRKKEIFKQLDDTKNYNYRVSAKYINGTMHIFAEKFNSYIPEKNEYFFVDYYDNKFNFYICNRSQFLHSQLGNKFKEYVSKYNPLVSSSFSSIEEIRAFYNENPSCSDSSYFDKKTVLEFQALYDEVSDLLIKIKNNEKYIRNPDVFDGPNALYNMCCFLKVEKQFEFTINSYSNNPFEEEYINLKESIKKEFSKSIYEINLNDIKSAFIYGLNDINDIWHIKAKYMSFENWIENL